MGKKLKGNPQDLRYFPNGYTWMETHSYTI